MSFANELKEIVKERDSIRSRLLAQPRVAESVVKDQYEVIKNNLKSECLKVNRRNFTINLSSDYAESITLINMLIKDGITNFDICVEPWVRETCIPFLYRQYTFWGLFGTEWYFVKLDSVFTRDPYKLKA